MNTYALTALILTSAIQLACALWLVLRANPKTQPAWKSYVSALAFGLCTGIQQTLFHWGILHAIVASILIFALAFSYRFDFRLKRYRS